MARKWPPPLVESRSGNGNRERQYRRRDGGADICRPCRSADDQPRPRRPLEGQAVARACPTPACRWPGCRRNKAAPAPALPTASPSWAPPAALRCRCRSRRRCSPDGCWRAPALPRPAGAMTVAPGPPARPDHALNADGTLSGRVGGIPFAKESGHIAVVAIGGKRVRVALVKTADCRVSEGQNLAGDASDSVSLRSHQSRCAVRRSPFDASALDADGRGRAQRADCRRAGSDPGAQRRVMPTSASPSSARSGNSRPCSKISRGLPAKPPPRWPPPAPPPTPSCAAMRSTTRCCSKPPPRKSAPAKPPPKAPPSRIRCIGAIGFTNEHVLHRFTLRLLAWRDDFGSESHWAAALGELVRGAAPMNSGRCWRRDRISR